MPAPGKGKIARRYASALASLIKSEDDYRKLEGDLVAFCGILRDHSAFRKTLSHPSLGRPEREALLRSVLKTSRPASQLTSRFLLLLLEKRRLEILEEIFETWRVLAEEKLGIVSAEVSTPLPLTKKEEGLCRETLEKLTGRKVRIFTRTDASLIGGVRARIGSQVYDGSVRRQLRILRERLAEGN
ncbi:MAG: ATP synthase F1 subunit delta [Acidobacteriota bacterium]